MIIYFILKPISFLIFKNLFLAVLGLCCCMASLVVASGGYSLVAVFRLLIAVTSPLAEHRLMGTPALVVVELGLNSCNSLGSRV